MAMRLFSDTITCKARYWALEDRLADLCKRVYRLQPHETTLASLKALVELLTQHEGLKDVPWELSIIEVNVVSVGMIVCSVFPAPHYGDSAAMQKHHITVTSYHYHGSKNPVINLISAYDYGDQAHVAESEAPNLLKAVVARYIQACEGTLVRRFGLEDS